MAQNNSNLIRGYSKAIFSIADQLDLKEQFLLLLEFLNTVVSNHQIKKILNNNTIFYTAKADFLLTIIKNYQQSNIITNNNQNGSITNSPANQLEQTKQSDLIKFLAKKQHLLLLPNIFEQYDKLYLDNANKLRITIISAVTLDDTQQQAFFISLTKHFNKAILLTCKLDNSIIAGVKIKYNDEVIDYSLKGQLLHLKYMLKNN